MTEKIKSVTSAPVQSDHFFSDKNNAHVQSQHPFFLPQIASGKKICHLYNKSVGTNEIIKLEEQS